MISGRCRVCGIIGDPVEHSMSPRMQNFYGAETGVEFAYVPFRVCEEGVKAALEGAYALHIAGLNVTVPHKQRVMPYLKEIDEDAGAIGAVNTLVRVEGGYKGYNSDAAGFSRALAEEGIGIRDQNCILIGAGGAAWAVAYVLVKEGAKRVYILNRNAERGRLLAQVMNDRFGRDVMQAVALEDYSSLPRGRSAYLAVQATSVGMEPDINGIAIRDPEFYEMIHTGVDIIYTPLETRFLSCVAAAGGRTMNGLSMLLYQGIEAFERWNPQVKVSKETVEKAKELVLTGLRS